MSDSETMGKINKKINPPLFYKVIYLDDSITSQNFVSESLVICFGHESDNADDLAKEIETIGSAVVAILPYEIAEQKRIEVMTAARSAGYPLEIIIEEDS